MKGCLILVFSIGLFISRVKAADIFSPGIIWEPETALTVPPYYNTLESNGDQSRVVVTSDGQVHITWTSFRPATPRVPQIYYKRFIPGVGWGEDTCISADLAGTVQCELPAIACDSQDNLHLVWAEYRAIWNIWYKMRSSFGVWDSVSSSISPGYAHKFDPVIACSPNGNVHVAWKEYDGTKRLVYREKIGDVWGPTFTVESLLPHYRGIYYISIAPGPDNSIHFSWHIETDSAPPRVFYLYRCRNSEGIWSEPETIPFAYSMVVNPYTGEPHIFSGTTIIRHAYKSGRLWAIEAVTNPIPDCWQYFPDCVFTPDTVLHVVWSNRWYLSGVYYHQLRHTSKRPGGQWDTIDIVTPDSTKDRYLSYPSLANGGRSLFDHHLYLVYDISDSNQVPQVYFVHGQPMPSGIRWEKGILPEVRTGSNLFVRGTRIGYEVAQTGLVRLAAYSALGRRVRVITQGRQEKGRYCVVWDGRDEKGKPEPAGVYYCRLETADKCVTAKMLLIR